MAVIGIVAEYNPLHKGHLGQLALTREEWPDAPIVVCMSGNWVQRGDCAIAHKWTRAKWAVQSGADLVLELPTVFALSSAETFAASAVSILAAAGATHLRFGCEDPDLPALTALARAADSPRFPAALRPFLDRGLSYPDARQRALATLVGRERAALLGPQKPNNRLGVEYLRAMPEGMKALPIQRAGAHHGPGGLQLRPDAVPAGAIRRRLLAGDEAAAGTFLAQSWEGQVYDLKRLERAILCALRDLAPEELEVLPDGGDGAARRLWKAARTAASLETLLTAAATRRLTQARLRRLTLWAFLGLSAADRPAAPEYLRVLAMSRRGAAHLSALKGSCPLPILTKSAAHRDLLALESRLTDRFALCAPQPLPCGEEWRHSPFILKN